MSVKFHAVSPAIWDRAFRPLSPEAKTLAFYVMTCRTRTSEGLFELSPGHIQIDTGLTAEQVAAAFEELHEAGVATYDPKAEVVLDRWALRVMPIRAEKDLRIKNALKLLEMVPDNSLLEHWYELAVEYAPPLADAARAMLIDRAELRERRRKATEIGDTGDGASRNRRSDGENATTTDVDAAVSESSEGVRRDPLEDSLGRLAPRIGGRVGGTRADEGPTKVLRGSSEGPRRAELRRGESRVGAPACATCGQDVLVQAGEVQVDAGERPWCGWCEGTPLGVEQEVRA